MLDPYQNGAIRFENANNREATAGRIAIRWAPTEQSLITLTHFRTRQSDFGGPDSYNTVIGGPNQTFTTTQQCFDTSRTVLTGTSPTTAVTCPAAGAPLPANIFRRAAVTYGPYNYLNDQSNIVQQWPVYAANTFNMTDLTIEYDFPGFTAKSITSLFYDKIKGSQGDGSLTVGSNQRLQGYPATATTFATGFPFNALEPFQDIPGGFVEGFYSVNARHGTTQEVRLASTGDGMPLSWVVGGYFSQINGHVNLRASENLEVTNRLLFGLRDDQRFVETLPDGSRRAIPQINGLVFLRDQLLSDTELAGFGEANYWITKRIKVTAGVRFSSVKFKYSAVQYGAQAGLVIPSTFNGGLADGRQSASPITPRFGLQYQINDANMVYVSASKGFRSGGVNAPLANTCSPGLATLGLTVRDIPDTYGPDTVWSYEGGAKLKLFQNRLQINSSVFRIDWNQVQLAVATPGCGPTYNRNAGTARSQGFDVQGQARVARGLVVSFSAGYTDAKYTQGATGPAPLNGSAAAPIVLAGQPLPVPKWQVNLGAQYDFDLSKIPFYVRADYQYTGKYVSGVPAGLPGYTPDTVQTGVVAQVNARVGGTFNGFDINLFMNNVFNSGDILSTTGGRGTCPLAEGAACVNYGTYTPFLSVTALRPREIGVQASRRF
jgi:iron complex outermembrane receptor protein